MRVAIVHDWLLGMRGGERCLEVILEFFPQADIFTLFYNPDAMSEVIRSRPVTSSLLDSLPGVRRYYRHLLPVYALGVSDLERKLKAGGYDVVLSINHCVAKNVRAPAGALHLCYCLTPVRYLWDQYDVYFGGSMLEPLIRIVAQPLRSWDSRTAQHVNRFMAISEFVRERIARCWGRSADVVYPPCRTDWIQPRAPGEEGEGFLCVNALVPYKNVELIVSAFNRLKLPLLIVGRGPEQAKLKAQAEDNIRFLDAVSDEELAQLYRRSRALVFAAEEDFGMVPVEIQAAGRPVICYGRGGVLETVSVTRDAPTGVYFSELNDRSLCEAVQNFIVRQDEFTVDNCLTQSRKFSIDCFRQSFSRVLAASGVNPQSAARVAA